MPTQFDADARLGDALPMTGGMTLLTYALLTSPDPLQADATGATLTLVVSNTGLRIVSCTQIVVILPVGPNAKDLTADATGIQTQVAPGWSASRVGGVFTLTPDTPPAPIGQEGLAFVFSGIAVNDQPGPADVTIEETAASPEVPTPVQRKGTITVPKFPAQFTVSDLTVDPPAVAVGATTMLLWTGTAAGSTAPASYTMSYNPGPGLITKPVGNDGPFTSEPLTQTPVVVFTLEVSVTVVGQDAPLVVQRQVTVQVTAPAPVIQQFTGEILSGTGEIQLRLDWATRYAEAVEITGSPNPFNPSGSWTITPTAQEPLASSYTLTATNPAGSARSTVTLGWGVTGPPIPVGVGPSGVAVTPDGAYALVVNEANNAGTVSVINARTLQVDRPSIPVGSTPEAIAITPDGARAFLVNDEGTVTVLAVPTFQVVGVPIPVGTMPQAVAIADTPDGPRAFVPLLADGKVTVLDAQTLQAVGQPITVGGLPLSVAIADTPDGPRAFVGYERDDGPGMVMVLDASTLQVIKPAIPCGADPCAIAITPDGARAFVVNAPSVEGTGTITVLDARTLQAVGPPIPVGINPFAVAIAVTLEGPRAFVANNGDGTVTIIDVQALRVIGSAIPVGHHPRDVAVTPDGARVFVVNGGDRTVTVLALTSVTGGTGG